MKTEKAKLLIFAEYFLPGYNSGGPVQSISNLISLLKSTYDIYLVTRDRDLKEEQAYTTIIINDWIDSTGVKMIYLSPKNISYRSFKNIVSTIKPTYIYLNSLYGGMSRIMLAYSLLNNRLLILAPRGELQAEAISVKSYKKKPYIKLIRFLFSKDLITWHATSQVEVADIKKAFRKSSVGFIPIKFAPDTPKMFDKRIAYTKHVGQLKMIFIARIAPIKNLLFLLDTLLIVNSTRVILDIYGHINDADYWQKCLKKIETLQHNHSISYKGHLSHNDVPEALSHYDLFVSPTLGESFGHSIYEAMSVGVPVLISDLTPWQDLEHQHAGMSLTLNKESWAKAIQQFILMDDTEYRSLSKGARNLSQKYIDEQQFQVSYQNLFSSDYQLVNDNRQVSST